MTASAKLSGEPCVDHFVTTHPGAELAIQVQRIDKKNAIWLEIHRVAKVQDCQDGLSLYITDCDRLFLVRVPARPLSSGFLGAKCETCWAHLPVEDVAA
jgi:hypothetical protein